MTKDMRQSTASLVVFERDAIGRQIEWLLQWNRKWSQYSLIGGHVETGETPIECCIREIREEVGLELGEDFELLDEHVPPLTYEAFSGSAQEMTLYNFFLFFGKIHPGSLAKLDGNPDNYWATEKEVSIGATQLGKRIAGQVQKVRKLLLESGLF